MGILVGVTSVAFYLFFKMYLKLMIQAARQSYDRRTSRDIRQFILTMSHKL